VISKVFEWITVNTVKFQKCARAERFDFLVTWGFLGVEKLKNDLRFLKFLNYL